MTVQHGVSKSDDLAQFFSRFIGLQRSRFPVAEGQEGFEDTIRIANQANQMLAVGPSAAGKPKLDRALAGAGPAHCGLDHPAS